MSISENVGGMSRYLGGLRTGNGYNDLKKNVADTLERIPGSRRTYDRPDQADEKQHQAAAYSGNAF